MRKYRLKRGRSWRMCRKYRRQKKVALIWLIKNKKKLMRKKRKKLMNKKKSKRISLMRTFW